jgi:glycosyltransferase domain-containing protein
MAIARTGVWTAPPGELLTAVIPAHNRVRRCIALVHFLRENGFEHPVVVADSSRPDLASAVRDGVRGLARYQPLDSQTKLYEKLARIARSVETPYIVLLPDDDIVLPHAITAALGHLRSHPDHVAAHGYRLGFGMSDRAFDIFQVEHFIRTIGDDEPLQRYHHMMRRYQPHVWAVFRTDVYALAMAAAASVSGIVFQEFMFQIVSVLQGKIARLPLIYAMHGVEVAEIASDETNPLQWYFRDSAAFFEGYAAFRAAVVNFLRHGESGQRQGIKQLFATAPAPRGIAVDIPDRVPLEQLVDLLNWTYLGRIMDPGMISYQVRYGTGEVDAPLQFAGSWPGSGPVQPGDLAHPSRLLDRRYVWRRSVMEAEPKDEISIGAEEIARTEAELDGYALDGTYVDRGRQADASD